MKGLNGMSVKAVFFDLFETLITEFADGKRISNRHYDYKTLLGLEFDEFKRAWSSKQERRMTGEISSYHEVIGEILEEHSLPHKQEAIEYLYQERIKEKVIPLSNIRPDIITLLQTLKQHHVKIGLISNCTEEEVRSWADSQLAQYFDFVMFSYEVGIAKPNRRIYEMACERAGVQPEETVFVGDGGSNELQGAEQAGITPLHAVWFNTRIDSPYKKFDSPARITGELL